MSVSITVTFDSFRDLQPSAGSEPGLSDDSLLKELENLLQHETNRTGSDWRDGGHGSNDNGCRHPRKGEDNNNYDNFFDEGYGSDNGYPDGYGGMTAKAAAGTLAGYMGTNGNDGFSVEDLYKLANGEAVGGKGQKPSVDVQRAAQYMLANPGVYKAIETFDGPDADGRAGIKDFQDAAQGNISFKTPGTRNPWETTGESYDDDLTTPQSASSALADYMDANGNAGFNVNDLYRLANGQAVGGKGQKPSAEQQQAARFMLENPDIYKEIETSDNREVDGLVGKDDFKKAARGADSASDDDSYGYDAPTPKSVSKALFDYMSANGNAGFNPTDLYMLAGGQPVGGKGQKPSADAQQAAQYLLANPDVYKAIETSDASGVDGLAGINNFKNASEGHVKFDAGDVDSTSQTADDDDVDAAATPESASGKLADYMSANGNAGFNVNDLYKLATGEPAGGKGQKPSADVQQAAQYMLTNLDVYHAIETSDNRTTDGLVSVENFKKAAKDGMSWFV